MTVKHFFRYLACLCILSVLMLPLCAAQASGNYFQTPGSYDGKITLPVLDNPDYCVKLENTDDFYFIPYFYSAGYGTHTCTVTYADISEYTGSMSNGKILYEYFESCVIEDSAAYGYTDSVLLFQHNNQYLLYGYASKADGSLSILGVYVISGDVLFNVTIESSYYTYQGMAPMLADAVSGITCQGSPILSAEFNVNNGTPVYYEAPSESCAPVYGRAIKNISTRTGPSTKYDEGGTYPLEGEMVLIRSRAWDEANDIWWVEVEIPYKGEIRVLWTGYHRFDSGSVPLESIPVNPNY